MREIETALIIAPHPDDDILGCGGIIARLASRGKAVYVAIMTNGNVGAPDIFPLEGTLKGREEARKSHKLLGVKDAFFYDFPTLLLETIPAYKISIEVEKLIRKLEADTIFIPHHGDIHSDHRVIFESCLVAVRPIDNISVRRVYTYETRSETEWAAPFDYTSFIPTVFFELSDSDLQKKIAAFECYSLPRKKEFPHSRSVDSIKALARYRGSIINFPYAEAFKLIREVND